MNRLALGLSLVVLSIISFFALRKDNSYLVQDDVSEKEFFSLGKRSPAGKIQHQTFGKLPATREIPTSSFSLAPTALISEQRSIESPSEEVQDEKAASTSPKDHFEEHSSRAMPRALQNFINPSPFTKPSSANSASNSKSSSPFGSSGVMQFFNTPYPLSKTPAPTPNTPNSSSGSGVSIQGPTVLTGQVKPLIGLITSVSPWANSFTAWAAANCTSPKVGIYRTSDLLKLGVSPLDEQVLGPDATFSFTPSADINLRKPQDYILQVTGCDNFLSRIVTAFDTHQNINLSSTLLSFSQVSPVNVSPTEVANTSFSSLASYLERHEDTYTSIEDVFQALNSGNLADDFIDIFQGSTPDRLKYSLPVVREVSVPTSMTEGAAAVFNVDATHWSPDYTVASEWFLNGVSTSFGSAWNWTPPGNSRNEIQISVRIGKKKDLQNIVDTTYPYHQFNFVRPIVNAISPIAPAFTLDSSIANLIDTPHLPLKISTGASMVNCQSFTSMAITETPTSPDLSEFNIICTQDNLQDHLHSLDIANRVDGNKTLYLWAKDDFDDISSTPSTLSFYLDQTSPFINISNLNATYGGNSTLTLNWTVTEQNATNAQNFVIEFFDGSSWINLPDVSSTSGVLTSAPFSTTHLLPDFDINNARFRITYEDILGHVASLTSNTFNIRVPHLAATPLSHNFGDVAAQSNSSSTTITFSNSGAWSSAACTTPVLSGDSSQFTILAENCSSSALAVSGSCTVEVRANPSTRQAYNANLNLTCGTHSASATLTVTGGNNPPVIATPSSATLNEDTPHSFTLAAGTDIDGDALVYYLVSGPSHGTITGCLGGSANLNCTYTPASNYFGTDSFTYQAYDGQNFSAPQTVTLTINSVNDAPTLAGPQAISGDEDTTINFILNAGVDIENDPLTYIIVTTPSHGSVSCVARNCSYTPNADYNGNDSFSYKVNDGNLDSSPATVNITINPINDAPVAASDLNISVQEDTAKIFNLSAGTDIDLPAQTLTYSLVSPPSHGTLTGCIAAGPGTNLSCTYTPNADYFGSDSFTYRVCDPQACSTGVTTVHLTIDPVNDPPVMIADQNFSLNDTQFIDFNLNGATDIDIPAQPLTYRIVSPPSSGTLSGCIDNASWSNNTSCRYTPPSNFHGDISFTYRAYDGEDQSVGVSIVTFTISDKTPSPTPVVTLASPEITNLTSITLTNSSCSDIDSLYVSPNSSTPDASATEWVTCNTTSAGLLTTISAVNATHTIYVWSKDQYGNVQSTPRTVEVIYDDVAPQIVIETESLLGNTSGNVRFHISELHASVSEVISLRYNDGNGWIDWTIASANGPLTQQAFTVSVTVPNLDDASLLFEVKYKDIAGNEGSALATIHSDLSQPFVDTISINSGASLASNNNLQIALSAHDATSKIRYFCLKYNDPTAPDGSSPCWKNVTAPSPGIPAAKNITFSGYYYQVGFIKATYTVYAWVKDEAGIISTNTQTLNVDRYEIEYDPGSPPRILALEATNSNTSPRPHQGTDLLVGAGGDVFVKWKAEDTEGFAIDPISLQYSTNDIDFTPIPSAQSLQNGVNGSCTLDADLTGCAVISAPTASYFKIRIVVKDDADTTAYMNSEPLNNSRLKIIAGNTEHGLGGSASTAVYYPHATAKNVSYLSKHKLAVSEDGKFFYLDPVRGLLWIDPATGALKNFIPTTGTVSGDGGNIASATLQGPSCITMDAYNHLLIWDHVRIRRVNLSTMTINTIWGGGGITEPAGLTAATSMSLGGCDRVWGVLIPLPNGDIIVSPGTGTRNLYKYRAADQLVEPMILSGQGFDGDGGADWNSYGQLDFAVAYDQATSAINFMTKGFYRSYTGDAYSHYVRILPSGNATTPYPSTAPYDLGFTTKSVTTSLDGKIYLVDRFRTTLWQYDQANNTQTAVVGTGGIGSIPCPENTLATSCAVDIDAFFISRNGRIYLMDSGVVRTIDDAGRIITLFGQFPSYGNGELASVARFGNIVDIKLGKHSAQNNKVIVLDGFSDEYREFTIDSTVNAVGSAGFGWSGPWRFEVDTSTGDILAPRGGNIQRFSRILNDWATVVGGGGTHYTSADGMVGTDVAYGSYASATSGFVNNKLYFNPYYWTGSYYTGYFVKGYDAADSFRQFTFMGGSGNNPGTPLINNNFGVTSMETFVDPNDSISKIFFTEGGSIIYSGVIGGNLEIFTNLPRSTLNFTHKFAADGLNFFYCSGGNLYKFHYTSGVETHLSWPSPTMYCKGNRTILYNAERNSIVFPFSQNSLDGVAEYNLN